MISLFLFLLVVSNLHDLAVEPFAYIWPRTAWPGEGLQFIVALC